MAFILALLVFNASAGCGRWVVRDNTDYLADPTFDALTSEQNENSAGNGYQDSAHQDNSQTKAKDNSASANDALDNSENVPDISGKWLVEFGDNSTPLNLILIQSGSRVQGYGSLKENGAEIPVTAIGSLSGNTLSLDITLVVDGSINKIDKRHKLELAASNGDLAGTYEAYLADKLAGKGNAVATRL
ncbi:MAG: hypothetical protein ACE14P_07660 [Methanotrichaceae archaeon]